MTDSSVRHSKGKFYVHSESQQTNYIPFTECLYLPTPVQYISKPPVEYLQTRFTNLYLYQLSLLAYSLTQLRDTIDYYIEVLVISNQLSVQSLHRKSYMICYQLRAYPGSGRYFSYAVATQARALEKYRTGYGD